MRSSTHAANLSTAERTHAQRLQRDLGARDIPLRAPFAAVVAERLHNPGEQVAQNDVLLELFDPQSLYVLAQVPVESASRIRAGMTAEIGTGGVDGRPGRSKRWPRRWLRRR